MSDPYSIARIFAQMELDLIASMKRNLARHEAEEEEIGFKWEQWQKRKLEGLALYQKENARLLATYGSEVDRLIGDMLRGSYTKGAQRVDGLIRRFWHRIKHLFISGELTEPITMVDGTDDNFFRINERRLNALIEAAAGGLREGSAAMLRMADDVYRQTIYKSQVYLNSGAATLIKAIDMATMDFLDKGFDCITFKDGRKVNIASYAEMVLRTSSQRAVFAGEGIRRQEWGIKTVMVSAHNNCSPLCLPWQGKPYVDDVYSSGQPGDKRGMTLLSTAMHGGLFHPNCRHNMSTYFPGISSLPEQVDDERTTVNYQAEQKQRYMERQIRRYKRREAGSVDPINQAVAAAKVKEWTNKLKTHLAQNEHLRRDRGSEQGRLPPITTKEWMEKKAAGDLKQHERYKRILGDEVPENLADFQRLKYTDSETWNKAKSDYRKLSAYDRIIANEPTITKALQDISEITGTDMVGLEYRVKSKESYLRKVNSDSKNSLDDKIIRETVANTNDVIRYTYQASADNLTDSISSICVKMEERGYSLYKLKNTWNDKRNPYKGVNAIFTSPEGQRFEVQFHTPESFELKDGPLHKLYEEARLDSTTPEHRAELTRQMFALSASLEKPKDIEKIK